MNQELGQFSFNLKVETSLRSNAYDGILFIACPSQKLAAAVDFETVIRNALRNDPSLENEVSILPIPEFPAGRLVYVSTGTLDPDYDDVRSLQEAAGKGAQRAIKAGLRKLLLVLERNLTFPEAELVTLLGVLNALYTPIQARETKITFKPKLDLLGVYTTNEENTKEIVAFAKTLENGRHVARDIGGADPERMTPANVQKYVEEIFSKSSIKISVIDDIDIITKEYPLFEAVNRAANNVERHRGRIMYLEYNPPLEVKETLFIVGKGVTYDTGGADIKAGGVMCSMSRDKCGAAAVAGFMKIVSDIKPPHLKVIGALPLVRNSVGANCYVSDEIITSRSGSTVRIGNTDAEGRMIMADVLCKMKEMAVTAVNPHLFTIATLTGHAVLAAGKGYSIVMDNGPARKAGTATMLQTEGHVIGDPFEISTIRREDFAFHRGKTEGDDIFQANDLPSTRTCRGHQGPAAFLILASGLDKHGSGSEKPLKYSHIDISPSAGAFPQPATAAPVLALARAFVTRKY